MWDLPLGPSRSRPQLGKAWGTGRGGAWEPQLTICPTQTLAASIMAPSAMERADSFSMWGFPDSSSSTTCGAGRDNGDPGSLTSNGTGEAAGAPRAEEHTLHFGILPG